MARIHCGIGMGSDKLLDHLLPGLACIAFLTGGISSEELREVETYDGPAELLESLRDSHIAR